MSKFSSVLLSYSTHHLLWVVLLIIIFYPGQNGLQNIVITPHDPILLPSLSNLSPYPIKDGTAAPSLTANAVVVQDAIGRSMLYERNAQTPMLPASTTKLMTALVALDMYPDLGSELTVKVEDRTLGQTMELKKGEVLTAKSLLAGLLIRSGNDAALTLANNSPHGYEGFVIAMNAKAKELGLTGTKYKNPSGLEQYDHITTARDLAILITEVVKHEELTSLMLLPHLLVKDVTGAHVHALETTDQLLGVIPGIKAAKTGFTENAGECLVTYVERDGHAIVTVVLRSGDRFGETAKLIDWAYAHHTWLVPPEL
ncbi:MAG: D-alanyl-D-alanine carboxypeptidase [bacterium]